MSQPATATWKKLVLPTYVRQPTRALPILFWDTSQNIYPDVRDDFLGQRKVDVTYDAAVLENEHLRVTIIPALGGKVWSIVDKNAGQEALHVPDCVKPGLIWLAGAWIPGGMEFNFPAGHHVDGMHFLPTEITGAGPDIATVRVTRTCRRTGLVMLIDISLRAGEARFGVCLTLHNPTAVSQRWYQWTNVGVPASPDWQFQCKATHFTGDLLHADTYPITRQGSDFSWYRNRLSPGDAFMAGCQEDFFGYYDHGRRHGLMHVAPWQQLPGKKYFTWGCDPIFNSPASYNETGKEYIEIQTGPMETQGHWAMMVPGESRALAGHWFPIAATGTVEWSDADLVLGISDGRPCLFATVPLAVSLVIDGTRHEVALQPGWPSVVDAAIATGAKVEIWKNGELARAFVFPLKGRTEKGLQRRMKSQKFYEDTAPKTAQAAAESARLAALHNANAAAVKRYRLALERRPSWHAVRLEYAESLWRCGDFRGGTTEFRKLLKSPLAAQARTFLARRGKAEAAFLAPAEAVPAGPERQLLLAERYAGYGHYEGALRIYRGLLRTNPDHPRVHYGLACYYWRVKADRRQAVRHADRAFEGGGPRRDCLIELAPLYLWAGAYESLLRHADADPATRDLPAIRKFVARARFEIGQPEAALAALRFAPIPDYEGETFAAEAYLSAVLVLTASALEAGDLQRAREILALGDAAEVDRLFFIKRMGSAVPRRKVLEGIILHRMGQRDEARKCWEEVLAPLSGKPVLPVWGDWGGPASAEAMYARGRSAILLGERRTIRRILRLLAQHGKAVGKFWEKRKTAPAYWEALLAELAGDYKRARRLLEKVVSEAPSLYMAKLHLAAVIRGRRYLQPDA